MQLPSIDRTLIVRPVADTALPSVSRVIPVAPVNPPLQALTPAEPSASVINKVNTAFKTSEGDPVYPRVADPGRSAPEAATAPKDWTIVRPAPEKVEDPPPKPMSQILMDHLRVVWTAGASAIQLTQIKKIGRAHV